MSTKLLLADDHDLVREAIAAILHSETSFKVTLAADLNQALECMKKEGPFDLVILDYNMPGMNGLEGLKRIVACALRRSVALISGSMTNKLAQDAISLGAIGALPKTIEAKSFVNSIKFMLSGEVYAPSHLIERTSPVTSGTGIGNLSARETHVLRMLCGGSSNKEIARELDLQEVTIKAHVGNLCRKLSARNRTQAVMIARDLNLI